MKIKDFLKTKWHYIVIAILPWVIVLIHSMMRESWLTGGGSILAKDAGTLYVELYSELWDKIHAGESLAFSWNTGLGFELGANVLRYLMSPFTLVMLIIPRAWIANAVQTFMVLKWSLLSVSMLFYICNTKHNRITKNRQLVSLLLALAYAIGNMAIFNLANLSALDVMILFPLLLWLEEKMADGKGLKAFYVLFVLMLICNYQLSIAVGVFLLVWYLLQVDIRSNGAKKHIMGFLFMYVAAIATSMIVILPCLQSDVGQNMYSTKMLVSFSELLQRFFLCDSLLLAQCNQPMLYCSIVITLLAMLFVFTKVPMKKKVVCCLMTILLFFGMLSEIGNLLWNGMLGHSVDFGFLLTFLLVYMAMETIIHLDTLKIWQIALVAMAAVAAVIYGFFEATLFLDFYVYLGTLLLVVFLALMVVFFKRNSIKYHNVLLVFVIVGVCELCANSYYQLKEYNMYTLKEMYYNSHSEGLSKNLKLEAGERVAAAQVMRSYGLMLDIPNVSQEHAMSNAGIEQLYQRLGMSWTEEGSEYVGASPVMNLLFNVRYGMSQSVISFSDVSLVEEGKGYNLYKTNRLAGLGYLVDGNVMNWDLSSDSPFVVQNDFIKKATGEAAVFEILEPEISCQSLTGLAPHADHHHDENCSHEDEEIYHGEYIENQYYFYQYRKMYSEDVANMQFVSDGKSDYYVFIRGTSDHYTSVKIANSYYYTDQLASKQKMLHIGVVPEGTMITISSNAVVDDIATTQITYQVAAFQDSVFEKAYEKLSGAVMQIAEMDDTSVQGEITASQDGVMMTSIPAVKGMRVVIDGNEVAYDVVGDALVAVPLSKGLHTVQIQYDASVDWFAMVLLCVGVVMFVGYAIWDKKVSDTVEA